MSRDGLWRLTLDTNPDDCNLHCIMCEEHSADRPGGRRPGPRRRMPFKLAAEVIEQATPLGLREVIPSTMGEPLLWDGMEQLLELCRARNLTLNLTTNGTWPRLGARRWAELLVPVTSDVKISFNGATTATQEGIMVGTRFERVLDGIREFVAVRDEDARTGGHRCRVTFQLTFLERNVDELPGIVALAADLGVDRVKGHHVWAHWPALASQSLRRSPSAIARWNDAASRAQAVATARGVLLENFGPLGDGAAEDVDPLASCPFLGREAWVATDGRFSPCCAPDELRRALGDFGTIPERSLTQIWRSAEYRSLCDRYRTEPLCRGCNMRRRLP